MPKPRPAQLRVLRAMADGRQLEFYHASWGTRCWRGAVWADDHPKEGDDA